MRTQHRARSLYFSDRVKEAMSNIFAYPLTTVEAPMGYGKTTAVREHLRNTRANVLWLKVHSSSVTDFWSGLCGLFAEVSLDHGHSLAQLGFPNDRVSLQEATRIIMRMEIPERTVLCIDDYHLLNETPVGSFVESIVVNEVSNLHIMLVARYIALPNVEELSLKSYLFHIEKERFELMPEDIVKYYRLCGIDLKTSEAEKLYSVTEGWISALYLLMLNYLESGNFTASGDIYKLVESAVYMPFSDEIKGLLISMSIFHSFSRAQAQYISETPKAEDLLAEIVSKNAFVDYDSNSRTYHIHNILTNYLQDIYEKKDEVFKRTLHQKAGGWYERTGEYKTAMRYYYAAGDFEKLLSTAELNMGDSFGDEQKEQVIKYFEECPAEIKQRHIPALLNYAMTLVIFNEMTLFAKACREITVMIRRSDLDPESTDALMGELELLTGFTRYNDIVGMSKHHRKACELLKRPSVFMADKGSWTFGSPSVLYMFYRESGKLEQEVHELKESMPYYYRLTNGHGMGAELIMEAERLFNMGDFEDSEITAHQALLQSSKAHKPNMVICAQFLLARLSFARGDYPATQDLLRKMHEAIEQRNLYVLIHKIDMCQGFLHAAFGDMHHVPQWLAEGDFNSDRLYFPARAFSNIIYGRVLLLRGEYLKLLGSVGHFMDIASVFPSMLAKIYTAIYVSAANEKLYRRHEAVEAIQQALDMAVADRVYMPFVENCDYIKPVLDELYTGNVHRKDIEKILRLYQHYHKSLVGIRNDCFNEDKPRLTEREREIAQLAAEGYSNRAIGERLFISQNTVKTQLKSVFKKTGVNSRSLLQRYFDVRP